MTFEARRVVLTELPADLFEAAVTYLADTLRECQLVLVDHGQGADAAPTLVELATGLVPDLEELRDLFRAAAITVEGPTCRVEVEMAPGDAGTVAHLQMQLDQLRYLNHHELLIPSDPDVSRFLTWAWEEIADQLSGRRARPYHPR